MKATDLMVGDLFKAVDYNSPFRITAIYDDVVQTQADYQSEIDGNWYSEAEIKDLIPIELTEDILVKNGFSEIHHPGTGATDEYSEWFFGGIKIIEWLEDWKYHYFSAGGDGAPIDFQYVHQLQHLLRLCGIEKEIEL